MNDGIEEILRSKKKFNIVVGPQRTGTTYLYGLLEKSSNYHVPLVKENNHLLSMSKWKHEYANWSTPLYLAELSNTISFQLEKSNFNAYHKQRLLDAINFNGTLSNYLKLFETPFSGFDLSPLYSVIDESAWTRIREILNPNIFIIYRSPVERCWSAVNLLARSEKYEQLHNIHEKSEFDRVISTISTFDYEVLFVRYSELIPMLSRVFGSSFQILNFKDLTTDRSRVFQIIRGMTGEAPDRIEVEKAGNITIAMSPKTSFKNTGFADNPPTWFREWYSHHFHIELENYESYLGKEFEDVEMQKHEFK